MLNAMSERQVSSSFAPFAQHLLSEETYYFRESLRCIYLTTHAMALVYSGPANYYIKKKKVTFGRKAAMPIQNRLTVA